MVQLSTPQVTYLGLAITPPHKVITLDKEHSPPTNTKDKILSFLRMASFLHSWIPFFLLSETVLRPSHDPS